MAVTCLRRCAPHNVQNVIQIVFFNGRTVAFKKKTVWLDLYFKKRCNFWEYIFFYVSCWISKHFYVFPKFHPIIFFFLKKLNTFIDMSDLHVSFTDRVLKIVPVFLLIKQFSLLIYHTLLFCKRQFSTNIFFYILYKLKIVFSTCVWNLLFGMNFPCDYKTVVFFL